MIEPIELTKLIHTALAPLNIELIDLSIGGQSNRALIRVFVDEPGGISIGRCTEASRAIADVFDQKDAIPTRYMLEVSSPGTERPLRTAQDYQRQLKRKVQILYQNEPEEKPLTLIGRIEQVDDPWITLEVDGRLLKFELAKIAKSKIVLEFK